MRKILAALLVFCASLSAFLGCASFVRATNAQKKKSVRKPSAAKPSMQAAPKVAELKEDGLRSLLGVGAKRERPLLVNFWATWCVPCREEFPDLVKIRQQYADARLDFVTVSLDDISDIGKAVPEFLREQRAAAIPAYLLHVADEGTAINFVDATWQGELPATFLFDRDGHLTFKRKGRVKPDELRAAIKEALKVKPQVAGAQQ